MGHLNSSFSPLRSSIIPIVININPTIAYAKYLPMEMGMYFCNVSGRKKATEDPRIIPSERVFKKEAIYLY